MLLAAAEHQQPRKLSVLHEQLRTMTSTQGSVGYDCACDIVALATTCSYVYVGEFLAVKPTDFMQHAGLDFNPLVDQRHIRSLLVQVFTEGRCTWSLPTVVVQVDCSSSRAI